MTYLFFIVAAVYASAGFGGASTYLALMALWGVEPTEMRTTALLCNIIVVSAAVWQFGRRAEVSLHRGAWISAASVPFAFAGGLVQLPKSIYFPALGAGLVVASGLLFFQRKNAAAATPSVSGASPVLAPLIGAITGLFSSLVGIGGGIFLSPLLHLLRWDSAKTIAATASLFILSNSVASLTAQVFVRKITVSVDFVAPLAVAVALGGLLGSRLSALHLREDHVRYVTAALVLYAGVTLLFR